MNLKEIIDRPINHPLEQEEAIYVIKKYVKARKGVDVEPKIDTTFGEISAFKELQLMTMMATTAIGWFKENGIKE